MSHDSCTCLPARHAIRPLPGARVTPGHLATGCLPAGLRRQARA